MELFIIRHGQSEADILDVYEGRADYNLTPHGFKQAELMAEWLTSKYKIDALYSSPLKRAAQTAAAIDRIINVGVIYDDDLMEFQNGLIAGMDQTEAKQKYPKPAVRYPHTLIHGMESDIQFRMRAETAFSKIINENPPDMSVAVVSHGGLINQLFHCFMGLKIQPGYGISCGDTCVHKWMITGNNRHIEYINSLVHLNI
jgi:2,3-bisphosphoglycerate-dependent phosphoglycerate mutase